MNAGDLDFMAGMLAHPEVMKFYPKCYTRNEAAAWIERQIGRYERDGYGPWLAVLRSSNEPIGQIGLIAQTVEGIPLPEIGYILHRPFWKQGFATEAASAVREYAFHALGQPRVISLIRPVNLPSQAVAERIGMKRENRVIQHGTGGFDHWVYSVDRPC